MLTSRGHVQRGIQVNSHEEAALAGSLGTMEERRSYDADAVSSRPLRLKLSVRSKSVDSRDGASETETHWHPLLL